MSESDPAQPVQATGPTLEDAIQKGLEQLGLTRNDVIIEIIEEGRKGMLGMGAREAVVQLTPLVPTPLPDTRSPVPAAPVTEEHKERDLDIARDVLTDLLAHMRIQATVHTRLAEPLAPDEGDTTPWVLDIQGPDLGVLIGRRGETLDALQYITRLIVSRELQRRANIILDVEGYKARRESSLRKLAHRMAAQASKIGRTVTLEPMPPNERRIIHVTLRNDDTVTTQSVGEGDRRKVTIIPNRSRR